MAKRTFLLESTQMRVSSLCTVCGLRESVITISPSLKLCKEHFNSYVYRKFKRTIRELGALHKGCKAGFRMESTYNSVFLAIMLRNLKSEFPFEFGCVSHGAVSPAKSLRRAFGSILINRIAPYPISVFLLDYSSDDVAAAVLHSVLRGKASGGSIPNPLKQRQKQYTPCWRITAHEMQFYCKLNAPSLYPFLKPKRHSDAMESAYSLLAISEKSIPSVQLKLSSLAAKLWNFEKH